MFRLYFNRAAVKLSHAIHFVRKHAFSKSKQFAHHTLNSFLGGVGFTGAVTILNEQYRKNIFNQRNAPLEDQEDHKRKKNVIASVYQTMGVELPLDKIHITYEQSCHKPLFFQSLSSHSLSVKLPKVREETILQAEEELIVATAKQVAYEKEHYHLLGTTLSGSVAGLACSMAKSAGYTGMPMMVIGMLSYGVASHYFQFLMSRHTDKVVLSYFPDYLDQLTWSSSDPSRHQKLRAQQKIDNDRYNNKQYPAIMKYLELHRCRFDPVKPKEHDSHPLTRAYKKNQLHLTKPQLFAISRLDRSGRVYLSEHSKTILEAFFEHKKKENTPLAMLYQKMNFSDFIERLLKKTYQSAYLDGRILYGRQLHEHRLMKALPDYPHAKTVDNFNLLIKIGTKEDTEEVFYDYLTLEEIAIKSLLTVQAVCLPVGDGRRDTHYLEDDTFKLPVIESFLASGRRPVVVAAVPGIEARNGNTVHPDLFMIFSPKNPNRLWQDMTASLRQSSYYAVSRQIYGDKLAIDSSPETLEKDADFILFGDGEYHQQWYVCAPAYKARMKLLYRSLLIAADQQMQAYSLGHSYNLKGMGLGYFSFSIATPIFETLSKKALYEVLQETELQHIQQINLINWPSQLEQMDLERPLHEQSFLRPLTTIGSIKIYEGVVEPFSSLNEAGVVGGTQACADAASRFGNEKHLGLPPSSSDEVATYYALLNPDALEASECCLRIKFT